MLPPRFCLALFAAMSLVGQNEVPDWTEVVNDSCKAPRDPSAVARSRDPIPFSEDGKVSRILSAPEVAQLMSLVSSPDDCAAAQAVGLLWFLRRFNAIPAYPPQLIPSLKRTLESGDRWPGAGATKSDHRVRFLSSALRVLVMAKAPGMADSYARVTKLDSPDSWDMNEVVRIAVSGLCADLPSSKVAENAIGVLLDRGSDTPVHSLMFCPVIPVSFAPGLARVVESPKGGDVTRALHAASVLVRIPRSERGDRYDAALWRLVNANSDRSEVEEIIKALRE